MFINIDKILNDKGKTRYWLSKETDIAYQNIVKLCNNETVAMNFDTLEKICKSLKCTPNDIFIMK